MNWRTIRTRKYGKWSDLWCDHKVLGLLRPLITYVDISVAPLARGRQRVSCKQTVSRQLHNYLNLAAPVRLIIQFTRCWNRRGLGGRGVNPHGYFCSSPCWMNFSVHANNGSMDHYYYGWQPRPLALFRQVEQWIYCRSHSAPFVTTLCSVEWWLNHRFEWCWRQLHIIFSQRFASRWCWTLFCFHYGKRY